MNKLLISFFFLFCPSLWALTSRLNLRSYTLSMFEICDIDPQKNGLEVEKAAYQQIFSKLNQWSSQCGHTFTEPWMKIVIPKGVQITSDLKMILKLDISLKELYKNRGTPTVNARIHRKDEPTSDVVIRFPNKPIKMGCQGFIIKLGQGRERQFQPIFVEKATDYQDTFEVDEEGKLALPPHLDLNMDNNQHSTDILYIPVSDGQA